MIFVGISHNDDEETEEEDGEVGLDDAILDEIAEDEVEEPIETEGFGLIDEKEVAEVEEEKKEDDDAETSLEEDAEDVDFDTFDDVDEM
jgi:hypothetical protein